VACFLLWPATWYLSAWWGQTEPIYVLPVLAALLAARAKRPGLAAALLGIGLMTKPQALPLAVPFAAWFLANGGWRGALRAAVIVGAVAVVVWLPFVPAGGPMAYLRNLNGWQNGVFPLVSVKAWNPWWLLQEFGAGGGYVSDGTVLIGPVTFRLVALAAAAVAWVVVFIGVYRRPTPANLAMGLAAASLGAFVTLTTMHERYAYPAFVFLLLGWPRREVVAAWLALGVAFVLDLVYAVPPPGLTLPAGDVVSVAGAVVLTAVALAAIRWTWRGEPEDEAEQSSPTSSLGRVAEAPS
jgi:Gpi18-like mannosyltransferase